MTRIYLDLETYRPKKEGAFTDEKIISAGLLIDETPYYEDSLRIDIRPLIINEWEGKTEREIVMEINEKISDLRRDRYLIVCGFGILRFDIPLLISKSIQYNLHDPASITKMWHDYFCIDFFQQLAVANQNMFKGLSCKKIIEVSRKYGLNPPAYDTCGADVKGLYEAKQYDQIEAHLKQDLNILRWLDLYGIRRLIKANVDERRALFREA